MSFSPVGKVATSHVFPESGLDGTYDLIVVVTDSLELFVKFRKADIVIHCRLVDFNHFDCTAKDGFLMKRVLSFASDSVTNFFKPRVFSGIQAEAVFVVRRIAFWAFCPFLLSIFPSYSLGYWVHTLFSLEFPTLEEIPPTVRSGKWFSSDRTLPVGRKHNFYVRLNIESSLRRIAARRLRRAVLL